MKEKLYRSRIDRVFGGVASGLAKYLNLDTILIRIIFIILAFINGIGIVLYIILWIVLPEDNTIYSFESTPASPPKQDSSKTGETESTGTTGAKTDFNIPPFPPKKSNGTGRMVVGGIFIVLGLLFLADRIFPYFDFEDFFPLLFIIVGITLLVNSIKK